jgi:hypothetical protein
MDLVMVEVAGHVVKVFLLIRDVPVKVLAQSYHSSTLARNLNQG